MLLVYENQNECMRILLGSRNWSFVCYCFPEVPTRFLISRKDDVLTWDSYKYTHTANNNYAHFCMQKIAQQQEICWRLHLLLQSILMKNGFLNEFLKYLIHGCMVLHGRPLLVMGFRNLYWHFSKYLKTWNHIFVIK